MLAEMISKLNKSSVARDYLPAFVDMSLPFLFYYSNKDKIVHIKRLSRGDFWKQSSSALTFLLNNAMNKGDRQVHYFSGNTVEDLAFRTAAMMIGTVPVTINWQADPEEIIYYKIASTNAKIMIIDSETPNVHKIKERFPLLKVFDSAKLQEIPPLPLQDISHFLNQSPVEMKDDRCIIFTSGTTGNPKGVRLTYGNYACNRSTFEQFLQLQDPAKILVPIAVNPLHHTNSTSITDWAIRRPQSQLHLVDKYSTQYWGALSQIVEALPTIQENTTDSHPHLSQHVVVAPLVSRHIDFLTSLFENKNSSTTADPVDLSLLTSSLSKIVLLLGSAPVGPTTTQRLLKYANRLPTVRFGSTETTLQACGIPLSLSQGQVMTAFKTGWEHVWVSDSGDRTPCPGYYIGRSHPGHTEMRVVKSVDAGHELYLKDCRAGELGYLVARGGHVMAGYVQQPAGGKGCPVEEDGWYLRLGDIGYWLPGGDSGNEPNQRDFYWQTRDSHMIIKGGANYSYEQIGNELTTFISATYALPRSAFSVAICGLRVRSEHEDECCVLVELSDGLEAAATVAAELAETLKEKAAKSVSKGAKPDLVLVGKIPVVLSKGVISVPDMRQLFKSKFYS